MLTGIVFGCVVGVVVAFVMFALTRCSSDSDVTYSNTPEVHIYDDSDETDI